MKTITKFVIFIGVILSFGCDEIVECLLKIEPEIHTEPLQTGATYSEYFDTITAEVKNDANDNDYDYFFEIRGALPPGITYDINYREIVFYGIPTEAGIYRFEVKLTVELNTYDEYDPSPTCGDSISEPFEIRIQ